MRLLKKLGWMLLVSLIVFNLGIIIMGKTYFYTAIRKTYLSGQGGPGIYDLTKFATREIPTGTPKPWVKSADYNTGKINPEELEYLKRIKTKSFVVLKGGKLFHEQYFDGHDANTLSNSFSMAKSIVAMLVEFAVKDGLIKDISDPVEQYLPEFNKSGFEKITIAHLLSMSSGLSWSESGGNPFSDNAEAYYGADLKTLVEKMTPESEPGIEFIYKSGNTQILGFLVERVTGKTLAEYASLKLWQPLGAEHASFWSLDKEKGVEKAYCCWYATATDFARFGQMLLQEGYFNDRQILDSNFVQDARTPAPLTVPDAGDNVRYSKRSFWLLQYKGRHYYYLRGILGQYIIILPEENAVVVRLGQKREDSDESGHPVDIYHYLDIAKDLLNK